ncbi:MAG: hypothetical protein AB8G96_15360 [Phycisphaerales bacterium]
MPQPASIISVLGTFALAASVSAAADFIGDLDSRGGSIQVFVDGFGSIDPVGQSYNTNPGENEWEDFDFDFLQEDGQTGLAIAEAGMETFSSYIGYDEDTGTLQGLRMSSDTFVRVQSSTEEADSDARAQQFDTMGFRVDDFDGEIIWMRLRGSVDNAAIRFGGQQHDFEFTGGEFSELIGITQNGEYRLESEAFISVEVGGIGTQTDAYAYNVELVPDDCPTDIDGNNASDFVDVVSVLSSWGGCGSCREDITGDGNVNFVDLLEVLGAWGPCSG